MCRIDSCFEPAGITGLCSESFQVVRQKLISVSEEDDRCGFELHLELPIEELTGGGSCSRPPNMDPPPLAPKNCWKNCASAGASSSRSCATKSSTSEGKAFDMVLVYLSRCQRRSTLVEALVGFRPVVSSVEGWKGSVFRECGYQTLEFFQKERKG
ncbi:hypothetical protein PHSY_006679 [Pseudozyma hubeiensis SY62]|uniref:Uncharacterized protein n=1 Tax=Pseudozyma hubeiensis (strain SY62) TaxID=1305764 RepID=R9PCV8_PSEHS|nr:hypothetical protein PHSY_006679 [Pseudozyma hubeiensis SY62]GAC99082.1 hypothetical protein PHSY_006679 [Pseudozyma hubeiensis SY62]